jgi:hypothetical protein
MLRWSWRFVTVVLLLTVVALDAAAVPRFGPLPISMRIEGYVGSKPEGVSTQATWRLRVHGKDDLVLHVTLLQVLTGDVAYFDVISALEFYPYAFAVYGPEESMQVLTQAAAGQKIGLLGTAQMSQLPGTLMLSSAELVMAPTPAPPAGTPSP